MASIIALRLTRLTQVNLDTPFVAFP